MSLATCLNSNRAQLLNFLLAFFIFGLVLESCNAHRSYYNRTNGKGSMTSMGLVKGYGKGGGGGGGGGGGKGASSVHVMRSKAGRNTTSINGTSAITDEPTKSPSQATVNDEPTTSPSQTTITGEPTTSPS